MPIIHNSTQIKAMMKYVLQKISAVTLCLAAFSALANAQGDVLSIDSCYARAKRNYPLIEQYDLIEKSNELNLKSISKAFLPQIMVGGSFTSQSDVTSIPISLPNMNIPELSTEQYKVYGDISENLTDILITKKQQEISMLSATMEKVSLDAELEKLTDRINQLYFGILLLEAQNSQMDIMLNDIDASLKRLKASVQNGVALESNLYILEAERLQIEQSKAELESGRKLLTKTLSLFIHDTIAENTTFLMPKVTAGNHTILRAENAIFDTQIDLLSAQEQMRSLRNIPRISLFLQSGYGNPALNMFAGEGEFYYIYGARLQWNISSLYSNKQDKQLIKIKQSSVEVQRDVFQFNISLQIEKQKSAIEKQQKLMEKDYEIIALREKVKNASEAQLNNGTITANEYMSNVNAESRAKMQLEAHKIQLLLEQYTLQTIEGNYHGNL